MDVAGPAARGLAFAVVLLAVFVPLLASADAAFAQLIEDSVPTADRPFGRFLVGLRRGLAGRRPGLRAAVPAEDRRAPSPQRLLGTLEWALPLGALVTLFAAFVALQLTTLFGGNEHVLETTGLTYSQYARSGFWQLLVVAALTFAVIAAAQRWAGARGRLLIGLLSTLCLLTLVVLASALGGRRRLDLLEATLGLHAPALRRARRAAVARSAVRARARRALRRELAAAGDRGRHRRRVPGVRLADPERRIRTQTSSATSAP